MMGSHPIPSRFDAPHTRPVASQKRGVLVEGCARHPAWAARLPTTDARPWRRAGSCRVFAPVVAIAIAIATNQGSKSTFRHARKGFQTAGNLALPAVYPGLAARAGGAASARRAAAPCPKFRALRLRFQTLHARCEQATAASGRRVATPRGALPYTRAAVRMRQRTRHEPALLSSGRATQARNAL